MHHFRTFLSIIHPIPILFLALHQQWNLCLQPNKLIIIITWVGKRGKNKSLKKRLSTTTRLLSVMVSILRLTLIVGLHMIESGIFRVPLEIIRRLSRLIQTMRIVTITGALAKTKGVTLMRLSSILARPSKSTTQNQIFSAIEASLLERCKNTRKPFLTTVNQLRWIQVTYIIFR